MTGEMTLSGVVLPVAASRKSYRCETRGREGSAASADNEPNAKADLPAELLGDLKITYVHTLDDVLQNALEKEPIGPPVVPSAGRSQSLRILSSRTLKIGSMPVTLEKAGAIDIASAFFVLHELKLTVANAEWNWA